MTSAKREAPLKGRATRRRPTDAFTKQDVLIPAPDSGNDRGVGSIERRRRGIARNGRETLLAFFLLNHDARAWAAHARTGAVP
jgi:hypothetical protein